MIIATLLVILVAGCDEGSLLPPTAEDPLFRSYVSLGNSITAGYQSDGINSRTQLEAYPVLLAEAMDTDFNVPLLQLPGCPPPLTNVLTGNREGPPGFECALRVYPVPPVLHNVAVPGAGVVDVLDNLAPGSRANPLTTILLGGSTQLEAAADADPTFVSVWIGNNDVLGAALAGQAALATPADIFQERFSNIIDSLQAMNVQGGLLIGVTDVTVIPHLSPGVAYWQADQQDAFQALGPNVAANFEVDDSCGPAQLGGVGEATLVPFRYAFGVLIAQAAAGAPATLHCAADVQVLQLEEIQALASLVQDYNDFIEDQAEDLGWAYYDVNPYLTRLKEEGQVPVFPLLDKAEPFGPYFSLDGVHPSALSHAILAEELTDAVNMTYGTNLEVGDQGGL